MRYFEDGRFTERVLSPPVPAEGTPAPDEWSALPPPPPPAPPAPVEPPGGDDDANGGVRREPDLPAHVAITREDAPASPVQEFDYGDEAAAARRRAAARERGVARAAGSDRGNGLDVG